MEVAVFFFEEDDALPEEDGPDEVEVEGVERAATNSACVLVGSVVGNSWTKPWAVLSKPGFASPIA
jgi:hypothetical protein